jgi:uncharacterized damage-inducible protein DinB
MDLQQLKPTGENHSMKLALVFPIFASLASGQNAPTISQLYDNQLNNAERSIVGLAEAMPAEKYRFAPKDGAFQDVRTFAQQARHVATVIYLVAAAAQKEKSPVEAGKNENGPETMQTKEQIVKFLKDAFAYAHKANQKLTAENQLEMVPSPFGSGQMARGGALAIAAWHSFDHYGQMVVYARMNNVVPPASMPAPPAGAKKK